MASNIAGENLAALRHLSPALSSGATSRSGGSQEDLRRRRGWTAAMFRAGHRLRYPQETTSTAIILFHRFCESEAQALRQRDRRLVVLVTCLFLAGKVRETPRRLRDVINCLHVTAAEPGGGAVEPPRLDQAYWDMKEQVVECEQAVLRIIGFDMDGEHPYRLLLNYARSLRLSRELVQLAWGFVNDFLFIPSALELSPPTLACAAISLAARLTDELNDLNWITGSESESESWMGLFGVDAASAALACNLLLDGYLQEAEQEAGENGARHRAAPPSSRGADGTEAVARRHQ